eukprot:5002262-Amphidinium_carterae.1
MFVVYYLVQRIGKSVLCLWQEWVCCPVAIDHELYPSRYCRLVHARQTIPLVDKSSTAEQLLCFRPNVSQGVALFPGPSKPNHDAVKHCPNCGSPPSPELGLITESLDVSAFHEHKGKLPNFIPKVVCVRAQAWKHKLLHLLHPGR